MIYIFFRTGKKTLLLLAARISLLLQLLDTANVEGLQNPLLHVPVSTTLGLCPQQNLGPFWGGYNKSPAGRAIPGAAGSCLPAALMATPGTA